ncbi:sensor histidine kinase [Chryseolinea lacunae]|uniref:histidine kinase n=1 Tax=Chryseolinea lacunae TaxID=2801331 RepID=A0ABS1KMT9_9BACT|nr:PAS domain S-box protein [Chryseolinea lacunae]MBL0740533.1 PAS domain S-box protein [Chryseolinea lacunae]
MATLHTPSTERDFIKAIDELRKSEERYHKMIAEVEDYAIILLDTDGIIQNWNKGAEKIKQYNESEILGQHFSKFYLPEDLARNLPNVLLNEAKQNGRATQEGWRKRKDGSRFWGSITITALHDSDNALIGYSKVTRDLTERKLAEDEQRKITEDLREANAELMLSEERYHQMVAEVQDYAIILLDPEGNIQNWNMGAQYIKGYSSEIIGQNFKLFYTAEDQRNNLPGSLLEKAKSTGRAVHEGWRVRKDGTKFWGSIVITALHNKTGDLIGYTKVTRDLTERKQAEEKLLAYAKELEIRNRDLEQFAYVTSHDLQEPLRKIRTFTDIIEKNPDNTALVNRYFAKINKAAERMTDLIKSVLNYSRLSQNSSPLAMVDLNDVVAQVKSDFELLIAEKQAVIVHDTLPSIPANRPQLEQLFSNLISNAIKFNENNPVITLRARTVNTHEALNPPHDLPAQMLMEIAVADNGIGFEPQYAKLIFTMFQRLEDQATYAGTGIGLALCKKIMENHHGYIAVASERGKGTTFYVYFPLHPPQH